MFGAALAAMAAETAFVRAGPVNGSGWENITATTVDREGNVIVAGTTTSVDLPGAVVTRLTSETNVLRSSDGGLTWRPEGPVALGSPGGFASHPSRPNVLLAGGAAGIFRSADGGATWQEQRIGTAVAPGLVPLVMSVTYDPRDPDVFYAAGNAGILRSTDGGRQWETLTRPYPFPATRVEVDPFDSSILLAETDVVLLRSVDRGRQWQRTSSQVVGVVAFDRSVAGRVFAYSLNGLFSVSQDHGATWSVGTGISAGLFRADPRRPGVLWVISRFGQVWRSENAGAQWQRMGSANWWVADFAASPTQAGLLLAATEQGISRSEDDGRTWTRQSTLPASRLFFLSNGEVLAALTPRGDIFVSKIAAETGEVLFTTYVGGEGYDSADAVALDSEGNIVVAGRSQSSRLPVVGGGFADEAVGDVDTLVVKLSPGGDRLLYRTRLGGSRSDQPAALFVDAKGNAYVAGSTLSEDWPATPGALQTAAPSAQPFDSRDFDAPRNGFVTKLDAAGEVVYSTLIGGARGDWVNGIVVDEAGNAWVTGRTESADFPVSADALQKQLAPSPTGAADAFVMALNAAGSTVLYSTLYGGGGLDWGNAIALDETGSVFVAGESRSTDFPTTEGAFQRQHRARTCIVNTYGAGADGFVLKLGRDRRAGFATLTGSQCYLSLSGISVVGDSLLLAGDVDPAAVEESYPFSVDPTSGMPVAFVGEMDREGRTFALGPLLPGRFPSFGIAGGGRRLHVGLGARAYAEALGDGAYLATLERKTERPRLRVRWLEAMADRSRNLVPGDLAVIELEGMEGVEFRDLGVNAGRDLPLELNGVRVWFDGHPAPILMVGPNRVVSVVPSRLWEQDRPYPLVEVAAGEMSSGRRLALVVPWISPKVLTDDQGRAVARNEDGTENSVANPARAGSVVTLYATGLGPMTPPLADGSVATAQVSRPVARFDVYFNSAGPAAADVSTMPGFVSALLQVNVRVPEPAPEGGLINVLISPSRLGPVGPAIAVQ